MFDNISISRNQASEIEHAIKSGRLSHALILEGADEAARLQTAKEIAKAVVCSGDNKPCGSCSACRKAESGNHPDIHYLKKDEKASMIKVDEIRALREKAMLLPNDGDKSVFIIEEAQLMGVQAQNALLKIFEEPAKHVCFILTCASKSSLLDTVISRATSYYLSHEDYYAKEDNQLLEAARQTAAELAVTLCEKNEFEFLKKTAAFQKDKPLFKAVLSALIPIFRDALVVSGKDIELISGQADAAKKLSVYFTAQKLISYIEHTQKMIDSCEAAANHNLLITRFCSVLYDLKTK
ncbi:MAG: hypothetical protein NC122_08935 [Faecalibacterium sp.]|nr:hypothetical protein [Ruminococcus sp.]MCM1486319.1 hypothetical protein [Faecalibacterium sp.]